MGRSTRTAACAVLTAIFTLSISAFAELPSGGSHTATPLITEKIDTARLVTLEGNVRADLTAERDLGPVEDALPLRLYLVLQRTPAQQADLDNLLARQQQPTASEYHHWLTPMQFGERFGTSTEDIEKITAWLESQGLHVNSVMNNASFIDFSATARDIREVFHAQLHYYNVGGGKHPALAQDPMVPAALAPVIAGIQGLNKLPAQPSHTKIQQGSYDATTRRFHKVEAADSSEATPNYANREGSGEYDLTPQDFYTIYNVNPLFTAGTKGANASVAVIEQSDIVYGTVTAATGVATGGDVATFRKLFGVPGALNMHVYHGYGTVTCNDPGVDPNGNGEEGEAALDAEWASALAPSSNLIFMSCDQSPNQGIISSEMALIDNNLSDVMSLSYGRSELYFTASDYSSQDTLYAQAAAQGQSFIVSAGDSGSDVKDQNTNGTATSGINVSGFGSPLVTVAGGTDFSDDYDQLAGGPTQTIYWGANSTYYANALTYVPETAWNSSCADSITAKLFGYTGAGYCGTGQNFVEGDVVGGSGGFSTHYAVPAYQSGITGYSGTKRAQPDISSFAASGFFAHTLIMCDSHVTATACTSSAAFGMSGGTSFVAPQFAGVGGLLVSYTGSRQGLLNPTLYALGKAQFTAAATKTACYSNGQSSNTGITTGHPASICVFNDVTTGNNDVPCAKGSLNCYVNTGDTYGILSLTGSASLTTAFASTPGYDEVSGIGTLNVTNLLTNWKKAYTSTTTVTASSASITSAQTTSLMATVKGATPLGSSGRAPAIAGTVSFATATKALGTCTLGAAGTCSLMVNGSVLVLGSNPITATFAGSKTYPTSASDATTVTVTGGAAAPAVTFAPASVAFGSEAVGVQTAAHVVTLKNTGSATLSITSIALSGTGVSSFVITAKTCTTTLAAAASCTFSVAFKPTTSGALSAAVAVTGNAGASSQSVPLTGTGTVAAGTLLTITPVSLAFGSETVGAYGVSQLVTIKNVSTAALTGTTISFTGTNATSFRQLSTCLATMAAGSSCTALISFVPQTAGALTAQYNVTTTTASAKVAITGTGVATATLAFSPTALTFAATPHGKQSIARIVTVSNTGTTTATFSLIGIGGTNPTAFSQLHTCGATLAAGAKCTVYVGFAPAAVGADSALLEFFDNAQGGYQQITLAGTSN